MTPVTTQTLADFLLARIAEDEELARNAPGPQWCVAVERTGEPGRRRGVAAYQLTLPPPDPRDSFSVGEMIARGADNRPFVIDHAARHDPARVLAECEAKRQIVELHDQWHTCTFGPDLEASGDVQPGETCPTLRLLALPYADRPDYRQEWRP